MKRSAATAWRLVTASQNASRPPSVERTTTAASGSRTMRLSHSVAMPSAEGARPRRPGAPRRLQRRAVRHLAVDTPASSSILAIEPFSGSKSSSLTLLQPPRSSIVNRPGGSGNLSLFAARTSSLTGR